MSLYILEQSQISSDSDLNPYLVELPLCCMDNNKPSIPGALEVYYQARGGYVQSAIDSGNATIRCG